MKKGNDRTLKVSSDEIFDVPVFYKTIDSKDSEIISTITHEILNQYLPQPFSAPNETVKEMLDRADRISRELEQEK